MERNLREDYICFKILVDLGPPERPANWTGRPKTAYNAPVHYLPKIICTVTLVLPSHTRILSLSCCEVGSQVRALGPLVVGASYKIVA